MKKLKTIALPACLILFALSTFLFTMWSESKVDATTIKLPKHNAQEVKDIMGIVIKESNDTPAISEEKALQLAETYTNNGSKYATNITAMYTILTDEGVRDGAISEQAKNKNPKLKEKKYLSEIPVWIVSYGGLHMERRTTVLTEDNIVIDATTGEFLYSFSYR